MIAQWVFVACLAVQTLAGHGDDSVRRQREFVGRFRLDFEVCTFEPCGIEQSWWVENPQVLLDQYDAIVKRPGERVFVSVMGILSERGRYGHRNMYSREFEITEVQEIRRLRYSDCQ